MISASQVLSTGIDPWGDEAWFTGVAWEASAVMNTTLAAFAEILPAAGGHFGQSENISTMYMEGAYSNTDWTDVGRFAGEYAQYFYDTEEELQGYKLPFSQGYIPYQFTDEQLIFRQQADISKFNRFQLHMNKRVARALRRLNLSIIGAGGLGTGKARPLENTWDFYGLRTICNNGYPFYNIVRPADGTLDCINETASIAVGAWWEEVFRIQQLCMDKCGEKPWLIIAPATCQLMIEREMQAPRVALDNDPTVRRPITGQYTVGKNMSLGYQLNEINVVRYNNNVTVIYDSDMPGSGPGYSDNEFLFLNPKYLKFVTVPNRFMNDPVFMQGGHTHLTNWYGVTFLWAALMLENPSAHAYLTGYELELTQN